MSKFNSKRMEKEKVIAFLRSMFLATGVIWFLCALAILIFKLSFRETEIALTLILPIAYALVRYFEKKSIPKE
ncbi:MAG: hypothetical protein A3E30_10725 [Fluviicola sp. RIFCSPHIGHO2_12_FULL_43_24]|nr:MAG: hypothetical protein CHH17_11795 [Candidatus Fluviicola riflensis]OGS86020.1 MAG: hypothetical protein A3E30_10725 [Fluviicola sp. RIFCSPHIGHO2_12_FULL_43_24]OGS86429.1 MAG: hypothetical protein A2724_02695 [Fluviicola sp. RIFCSPHIGHO2_01_FULL_43_53]